MVSIVFELAPTVNVFNGGPTDIFMTVNRGAPFTVPGVGAPTWSPALPASGGPGFDNGGPSTNKFGPGSNNVGFQVGTAEIYYTPIVLPNVSVVALQIYLLLRDAQTVEWYACTEGMVVASSYGQPIAKVV